jgi:AcrR family transcriptional regulator
MDPLPMAGGEKGWERQRAAASRNQDAILRAAAELFARDGVAHVDVRLIAAAAGVGVGTVYRRFGDKASLIAAILGEQERALQDAVLRGPPPLGPGAPPRERLEAFLETICGVLEANMDKIAASEAAASGERYRIGAVRAWRQHLTILLDELGTDLDSGWLADLLLAPLSAALYRHQRRELGLSAEQIARNLTDAARRLTA